MAATRSEPTDSRAVRESLLGMIAPTGMISRRFEGGNNDKHYL